MMNCRISSRRPYSIRTAIAHPLRPEGDIYVRQVRSSVRRRTRSQRSWDRSLGSRGATSDRDRSKERDPRDVFTRDVDLPRGRERRPVRERDRVYEIDGSESRVLATIGAFRVVSESDLHDLRDDSNGARRSVRHLEEEGLIRTSPLSSEDRAVVLTERGRDLLEANRYERDDDAHEPRQTFYAGLRKPRELTHDTKVYRAYQRAEERLRGQGGRVQRVVLDYELKRDYPGRRYRPLSRTGRMHRAFAPVPSSLSSGRRRLTPTAEDDLGDDLGK